MREINQTRAESYKAQHQIIHSQNCVRAKEAEGRKGGCRGRGRHMCSDSQTSNLIREVVQNISNELETMCNSPG